MPEETRLLSFAFPASGNRTEVKIFAARPAGEDARVIEVTALGTFANDDAEGRSALLETALRVLDGLRD